jgi:hypothetical protein
MYWTVMTFVAMLLTGAAHAATIAQETRTAKSGKIFRDIVIDGKLNYEDASKFDSLFQTMSRAGTDDITVKLTGPGGNLVAGLQIGDIIHKNDLLTWVPEKFECLSICATMWISSQRRWATSTSLLGFHAPVLDGQESGAGGALMGAAYTRWGLSSGLILYLTTAAPDQLIFLTEESAGKYELAYKGELPNEGFVQLLLQEMAKDNKKDLPQREAKKEEWPSSPLPPPPQQQQSQSQSYAVRLTYNLNLRAAPVSSSANILDYVWPNYIPQNSIFTFRDFNKACTQTPDGDVWCKVDHEVYGQTYSGWVNAYYLELADGTKVQCLWRGARGCNTSRVPL